MSTHFINLQVNLSQGPEGRPGSNGTSSVVVFDSGSVNSYGSVESGTFQMKGGTTLSFQSNSLAYFGSGSAISGNIVPYRSSSLGSPAHPFDELWLRVAHFVSGSESTSVSKSFVDRLLTAFPSDSTGVLSSLSVSTSLTASSATGAFYGAFTGDGTQLRLGQTTASWLLNVKLDSASLAQKIDQHILRFSQAENAFVLSPENAVASFSGLVGIPGGLLSGSAQIAANISGAIGSFSSSVATQLSQPTFPYFGTASIVGKLEVTQSNLLEGISLSTPTTEHTASSQISGGAWVFRHRPGIEFEVGSGSFIRLNQNTFQISGTFNYLEIFNDTDIYGNVGLSKSLTVASTSTLSHIRPLTTRQTTIGTGSAPFGPIWTTQLASDSNLSTPENPFIKLSSFPFTNGTHSGSVYYTSSANSLGTVLVFSLEGSTPQAPTFQFVTTKNYGGSTTQSSFTIGERNVSMNGSFWVYSGNVTVTDGDLAVSGQGTFQNKLVTPQISATFVVPDITGSVFGSIGTSAKKYADVWAGEIHAGGFLEANIETLVPYARGTILAVDHISGVIIPANDTPEMTVVGVADGKTHNPYILGAEYVRLSGSWSPGMIAVSNEFGVGIPLVSNESTRQLSNKVGIILDFGSGNDTLAKVLIRS